MTNLTVVPSLFHSLEERFSDKLNTVSMTKAALVDLSHLLEEVVINNKLPALVMTGFQESGYWGKEAARYLELAGIVSKICVFAAGDLPERDTLIQVRLQEDDPLRQEWFLIVITEHFCAILCGLDSLQTFSTEAERTFDTIFTFDPELIKIALDVLEVALEKRNPAKLAELQAYRSSFILRMPESYYFDMIMSHFLNRLFKYQEVAKQLAVEKATRAAIGEFLHQTSQPLTAAVLTLDVMRMTGQTTPQDVEFLREAIDNLKHRLAYIRAAVQPPKNIQELNQNPFRE